MALRAWWVKTPMASFKAANAGSFWVYCKAVICMPLVYCLVVGGSKNRRDIEAPESRAMVRLGGLIVAGTGVLAVLMNR
jgi:hypothetical protein